ncbi:MAG: hypothetical protein ACI9BK_003023 [Acidimicrobiales bacterium]
MSHLGDADLRQTIGLYNVKIYLGVQHDFEGAPETARRLEESSDPFAKAVGTFWRSIFELRLGHPEKTVASTQASIALVADMTRSVPVNQILDGADLLAGRAHAHLGDHETEVRELTSVRHRGSAQAPRSILLTEALASLGVAYLAQGDPRLRLGAVNGLG